MGEMLLIKPQLFYGTPTDFMRMRTALAKAAGIPTTRIHIVSEEGDDIAIEVPDLEEFDIEEKNIYGDWDELQEEPLLYLLAHSDERGVINEDHMLPLIARIRELMADVYDIVKEDSGESAATTMYRNLDHFSRMLADAYARELPVTFFLEETGP